MVALATLAGTAHPAAALVEAELNGANVVPGPGDPDGSGTVKLSHPPESSDLVCFHISVEGISEATSATLHRGVRGTTGQTVGTLQPPTSGSSDECLHMDLDVAYELKNHPENFYVQVSNEEHPDGALRGNLHY
ncbi:hypothetical protein IQ60_38125 [Streptomyces europaeiscabiei]|nr:hypothetical protein IQ60_38125 [Streptomyces europaeiscabiei]